MAIARGELLVTEVPGGGSSPRINEYLAIVGIEPNDEHAWCSAFVNWVMAQSGIQGTRRANARSWLHWGVETTPRVGAVAVLWRVSREAWQGHVGFLLGISESEVLLLGGKPVVALAQIRRPRQREHPHPPARRQDHRNLASTVIASASVKPSIRYPVGDTTLIGAGPGPAASPSEISTGTSATVVDAATAGALTQRRSVSR